MSMLKDRDIHFDTVEGLNEKFSIHPLQGVLRYGMFWSACFMPPPSTLSDASNSKQQTCCHPCR